MEKRNEKQKDQNNRKSQQSKNEKSPPSPAKILIIYVEFLYEIILCVMYWISVR